MQRIRVIVFKPSGRQFFHAQWTDPVTGKKRTESTKTAIRRKAERFGADKERELNEQRNPPPGSVTWEAFKQRYEDEVVPGLAERTGDKISDMFAIVERYIAPVSLSAMDESQISTLIKRLRTDDKSENTIRSHLGHLRAALNWAASVNLIRTAPKVKLPKQQSAARHRAITGEEFDRLIKAVPKVVGKEAAPSFKFLLRGLWFSGLRSGEALNLTWDDERRLRVQLDGRFPMIWIPAALQKNRRNGLIPMAPEFAELLRQVPEANRKGFVFNPAIRSKRKQGRLVKGYVEKLIGDIGEKAKIVVSIDHDPKKPEYATAHDLRRAFGFRWSQKVMPAVLKEMMRHSSINTTMQYYAISTAEATAATIWSAHNASAGSANTLANTSPRVLKEQRNKKPQTQQQ